MQCLLCAWPGEAAGTGLATWGSPPVGDLPTALLSKGKG